MLCGNLVSGRSAPSAPYNSPPGQLARKQRDGILLSDYAAANIKPGDTVRVNGWVFADVDDALGEVKRV